MKTPPTLARFDIVEKYAATDFAVKTLASS
jgi:hypothetical protein